MKRDFGIIPGEDHYVRLIDLLGRAGRIGEARDLIKKIPFEPTHPFGRPFFLVVRLTEIWNLVLMLQTSCLR
jgi:hypothetical protein